MIKLYPSESSPGRKHFPEGVAGIWHVIAASCTSRGPCVDGGKWIITIVVPSLIVTARTQDNTHSLIFIGIANCQRELIKQTLLLSMLVQPLINLVRAAKQAPFHAHYNITTTVF